MNVLRSSDAARELSDADFAAVLAFVDAAFTLALHFAEGRGHARRRSRSRP